MATTETKPKTKNSRRSKPDPAIANWRPATIVPPRPQICSSKFQGKKPFYPKFLQEDKKADLYLLLSEEYRRMWFKALDEYYIIEQEESQPMPNRPYLIRNRKPKRNAPDKMERFIMKRFQNITAKTDSGDKHNKKSLENLEGLSKSLNKGGEMKGVHQGYCTAPVETIRPIVTVINNVEKQ